MGELEVIIFLEKNKDKDKYYSLKEIIDALGDNSNGRCIARSVAKLSERKEIKIIKLDVKLARKFYGKQLKKGMKLYYIG